MQIKRLIVETHQINSVGSKYPPTEPKPRLKVSPSKSSIKKRERNKLQKKLKSCHNEPGTNHTYFKNASPSNNLTPPSTPSLRSLPSLRSPLTSPRNLTHRVRRTNMIVNPRPLRTPRPMRPMPMRTRPNLANRVIRRNMRVNVQIRHALRQRDIPCRQIRVPALLTVDTRTGVVCSIRASGKRDIARRAG